MKKEKLFTITETQLEHIIKFVIDKMYAELQGENYKQLQRKIAEYEELRSELKNEKTAYENEIEIYDQTCLDLQEELKESISECKKMKKVLDAVKKVIEEMDGQTILTFPDFYAQENYKIIMKQLNDGYIRILDVIKKAKENKND